MGREAARGYNGPGGPVAARPDPERPPAMAIAPGPATRYGSAAELAAVAGVSVKTVRRQVAAGALPSVKLGRRRLIPLDALERRLAAAGPEPRRDAPMSPTAPTAPAPAPPPTVDARGKLIPLTPEQQRQRAALALAALDDIERMGDEAEQRETFNALAHALNEDRAAVGARLIFADLD